MHTYDLSHESPSHCIANCESVLLELHPHAGSSCLGFPRARHSYMTAYINTVSMSTLTLQCLCQYINTSPVSFFWFPWGLQSVVTQFPDEHPDVIKTAWSRARNYYDTHLHVWPPRCDRGGIVMCYIWRYEFLYNRKYCMWYYSLRHGVTTAVLQCVH